MPNDQSLVLPDGRTLSYTTFGVTPRPDQPTIFHFHGLPGSHHEGQPIHEAAVKCNVCVVAVTRPGYGGSTFQPNRTILSFPQDVLRLADHLNIDRFAVLGVSGGGPYALACLHSIPSTRLAGAAIVSGMYPTKLGLGSMMLLNRVLFTLAPWVTWLVEMVAEWEMGNVARDVNHPERLAQSVVESFKSRPIEDQEALFADDGRILSALVQSTRDAVRESCRGFAWEARLFGSPWGFELGDLVVEKGRLVIWHGGKDINVPRRMAVEAAEAIPGAELRIDEDEAHVSLLAHRTDNIIAALTQMLRK